MVGKFEQTGILLDKPGCVFLWSVCMIQKVQYTIYKIGWTKLPEFMASKTHNNKNSIEYIKKHNPNDVQRRESKKLQVGIQNYLQYR